MDLNATNRPEPSPYRRGANYGLLMGVWLSVCCGLLSQTIHGTRLSAMLTLTGVSMALLVPVLLMLILRGSFRADNFRSSFMSLWTEGIMTFVFGSVVTVVAGYVYMRLIDPRYLHALYSWMLDSMKLASREATGEQAEQYRVLLHNFTAAMDRGELPGELSLLLNTVWFTIFSGSLLSAAVAAVIRLTRRRSNYFPSQPPQQ